MSQILFVSDYPHAEGLAVPMDFSKDLNGFSDQEIKQVMSTNGKQLVTPNR